MDVVDSAFSGTPFQGSNIVRETLLLSSSSSNTNSTTNSSGDHDPSSIMNSGGATTKKNATVTFHELTLVTARGLRHETNENGGGAFQAVQHSLDDIIFMCFQYWSKLSLYHSAHTFQNKYNDLIECATTVPDQEWQRMMGMTNDVGSASNSSSSIDRACRGVSPSVVAYILHIGSILNSNIAPSDCLSPVPNLEHATSLGITISPTNTMVPTFMEMIRWSLLDESLHTISSTLHELLANNNNTRLGQCGVSALIQFYIDVTFIKTCYVDRNRSGFNMRNEMVNRRRAESLQNLDTILKKQIEPLIVFHKDNVQGIEIMKTVSNVNTETQYRIFEMSDLFVSSLFGTPTTGGESSSTVSDSIVSSVMSEPMFPLPLPSARRFVLLPVQIDRSLSDIQGLQNKYNKEEPSSNVAMDGRTTNNHDAYHSSNVISGGLGFLSSMLKTKK